MARSPGALLGASLRLTAPWLRYKPSKLTADRVLRPPGCSNVKVFGVGFATANTMAVAESHETEQISTVQPVPARAATVFEASVESHDGGPGDSRPKAPIVEAPRCVARHCYRLTAGGHMRLLLIPVAGGVGLGPLANLLAVAESAAKAGHDVAFMAKDAWAPEVRNLRLPGLSGGYTEPRQDAPPPPYNLGAVGMRLGWIDDSFIRASIHAECSAIYQFKADVVVTTLQFTAPISAAIMGRPSAAIFSWADGPSFASPLYDSAKSATGWEAIYNHILADHGLESIQDVCDLAFMRSELRVAPTIPELQPELVSVPETRFVGYLLSDRLETREFPGEIKNGSDNRPVVYVYLGPGDIPADYWIPIITETFVNANFNAIVTLAQTGISAASMPQLANVRFYNRLPGMTAIAAADLVISHGGLNTVNNALLAGKPHIIFPDRYAERDYNGRSLARLRAGINCSTEQLEPRTLRLIAEEILSTDTYAQNAAQLGLIMREYGGADRVIELVESSFPDRGEALSTDYVADS